MATTPEYDGGLTAALRVTNLDAGIAWYRDVLGFELVYRMDEMGWCELKSGIGNVQVGLSQVDEVPKGGNAVLTFGVKDIDAARALLEAQDVPFDGATQVIPEMVALATFFDPDGNTLMFYQDLGQR